MRFSITSDHRAFFAEHHFIEFAEVLPLEQVAALKLHSEEIVARRLRISREKLSGKPAPEIYQAGYDLWRESDTLKKIIHKYALASIASELLQTIPLRMGFDQFFCMTKCTVSPYDVPSSLQDISCLSPLAGGLLLPLVDLAVPPTFFPLPLKAGSGLFISPSFSLPWPQLFSTPGLNFLLIAFAPDKTSYRAGSHDPHAVALKKLGYVFNDHLNDKLHPILFRKS